MVSNENPLLEQAQSILEEVRDRFPGYRRALDGTEIRISKRLTRSAGNACPKSRTIGLSEPIFSVDENRTLFRNTVLHELAHVIVGPEVQAHGHEWRNTFLQIGGNGERCHQMRARGQHHQHQAHCEKCQEIVEVGSRIFNRIGKGSRDYRHIGCGGVISSPDADLSAETDGWLGRISRSLRQTLLFGGKN